MTLERFHLWQGHHHRWRYNHRVNRLGSWVRHQGDAALLGHAGASGTGADTLAFEDRAVRVDADGVRAVEGFTDVVISAKEEHRKSFVVEARVATPAPPAVVLLNGYDLVAIGHDGKPAEADKLLALNVGVSPVAIVGNEARFTVLGGLNVDCDSAECDLHPDEDFLDALARLLGPKASVPDAVVKASGLAQKFDRDTCYRLRVYWIVLCGAPDAMHVTPLPLVRHPHRWGTMQEVSLAKQGTSELSVALRRPAFPAAVLGITQLHLRIRRAGTEPKGLVFGLGDKAAHLLELDQAVRDVTREGTVLSAHVEQLCKNWTKKMPALAFRDATRGHLWMGLSLVELAAPRSAPALVADRGELAWKGGDKPADDAAAMRERPIG